MDELQKKLKRLERIEKAIKAFKIGYDCSESKETIVAEAKDFLNNVLDIYLEGWVWNTSLEDNE